MLELSVSGQILRKKYVPKVVGDSQGYLYAKFHFSKDWDGVVKTAFFKKNGEGEPIRQFIKDGVCLVPWEVLVGDGFFTVACYGTNQPEQANKFITTNEIQVDINESAFPQGIDPTNPTEGLWGQGLAEALQQIRDTTNGVVAEVTTAGNDAKADALGAIELAKTGALEAIATDKQGAVDAIKLAETTALGNIGSVDTIVTNALKDIEDKRVATITEVTSIKDSAVTAVKGAESLAVTNIGNHKDEAVGMITTGKLEATEAIAVDKAEALKAIGDASDGVLQQMGAFGTVAQQAIIDVSTKGDEKVALIRSESKTGLDNITKAKNGAVTEITTLTTNSVNTINENKQGNLDLLNDATAKGVAQINEVIDASKASSNSLLNTINQADNANTVLSNTVANANQTTTKLVADIAKAGQDAVTEVGNTKDSVVKAVEGAGTTAVDSVNRTVANGKNDISKAVTEGVGRVDRELEQVSVDIKSSINATGDSNVTKVQEAGKAVLSDVNASKAEAKSYAESAKVSETNAKASETNASASAETAKTEADRAKQEADRASGMLDDTVISKDKTWSSQTIADHIGYEVSASGSVVKLDNLMGGGKLDVTSHYAEPVTEDTLYVGGKNLFSYPYYDGKEKIVNGITFVDNGDGTITANGTTTGIADFILDTKQFVKKGMRILGCPRGGSLDTYEIQIYGGIHDVLIDRGYGYLDISTHDFSGYARCRIRAGVTVKDLVFKPYLTFDDSFETYQKGQIKKYTATFPTPVTEHTWQGVTSVDGDNVVYSSADSVTVKGQSKNIIDDVVVEKDRTFSNEEIVNRFCLPFKEKGSVVSCHPMEGSKLAVISEITPQQEGEGEPSPNNVRNFIKFDSCELQQSGKNLTQNEIVNLYQNRNNGWIDYNYAYKPAEPFHNKRITYSVTIDATKANPTTATATLWGRTYSNKVEIIKAGNNVEAKTKAISTITTIVPSNFKSIYLGYSVYQPMNDSTILSDFQLEVASSPTPYEPYRGKTYSQSLVGYEGKYGLYNWNTGKMLVQYETRNYDGTGTQYVLDRNSNDESVLFVIGVKGYSNNFVAEQFTHSPYAKSNITIAENVVSPSRRMNGYVLNASNGSIVYVRLRRELGIETAEQFQALAQKTPMVFTVPVEPYEIQLSPTDIRAIADLNQLYSNTGDTEVTGRENPIHTIKTMHKMITELGGKENV